MKSKILSLVFALSCTLWSNNVNAWSPPPACIPPISDYTACGAALAQALATPICAVASLTQYKNCNNICSGTSWTVNDITCCLETLAANNVALPSSITSIWSPMCQNAFGYVTCGASNTIAQYGGWLCCSYCSNSANKCSVDHCLSSQKLQCSAYEPASTSCPFPFTGDTAMVGKEEEPKKM